MDSVWPLSFQRGGYALFIFHCQGVVEEMEDRAHSTTVYNL